MSGACVRHVSRPAIEPPTLSDGDLTLRATGPEDADALTAACQDPEIPRWARVPSPYRRADAESSLARSEAQTRAGVVMTLVVDAGDGRLAGSISLMGIDRERGYGEIGYWVAAAARGRGVATRAVRLLRDWAAEELGLTTLEILIHRDNAPSRAVARAPVSRRRASCAGARAARPRAALVAV